MLVLAALSSLAAVSSLADSASTQTADATRAAIALEKKYYVDLGIKESLHQVLASAEGIDGKSRTGDAAAKLVEWEARVETVFEQEGTQVDVWQGVALPSDVEAVRKAVLADGALDKSGTGNSKPGLATFDFQVPAPFFAEADGLPVLMSELFLQSVSPVPNSKGVKVGAVLEAAYSGIPQAVVKRGLAELGIAKQYGQIGFGSTIYFPNEGIAANGLMPEGFD